MALDYLPDREKPPRFKLSGLTYTDVGGKPEFCACGYLDGKHVEILQSSLDIDFSSQLSGSFMNIAQKPPAGVGIPQRYAALNRFEIEYAREFFERNIPKGRFEANPHEPAGL